MPVLKTQSEFGHAPPPQTPYSIISNLPGWDLTQSVRDGDTAPLARLVHIYPRFGPTQYVRQLGGRVGQLLGLPPPPAAGGPPPYGVFLYLNPDVWAYTRRHATSKEHRGAEVAIQNEDLSVRCVDVAGHRLYAIVFEFRRMPAVSQSWGNPGLGLSIRGAEMLLGGANDMKEVTISNVDGDLPPPTWTPETEAHGALRERIVSLLQRAPAPAQDATPAPSSLLRADRDVFLYPSGMGAVWYTSNTLLSYRPGSIVIAGVVFHNTFHHLLEESPHGWKHAGRVDSQGLDELEAWLEEEAKASRPVSYLLIEFPGNPTLASSDLRRLKRLSIQHSFVLVVDDTLSGFANVDVLPYCDILLTSLTKSFSGLSDVLGGSIVLNPASPYYEGLSAAWASHHRNELFAPDAEVLLSNSQGFLERTAILNANAHAVASFLQEQAEDPSSPVAAVLYPSLLPDKDVYDSFKTSPTKEIPEPGYGCLLSVDFDSLDSARTFYNACGFYPSPHLGGHVTIMFAYNMFVYGRKPEERAQFRSIGVKEESVRISVGLEDVGDIIDTIKDALAAVGRAKQAAKEDKSGGE